jgi:transcriptional regulator with XRE-family HTH domain
MDHLGEWIRAERSHRGLSQATLAAHLGASQATVSQWEVGKRAPSGAELAKLTALFGELPDALAGVSPAPEGKRRGRKPGSKNKPKVAPTGGASAGDESSGDESSGDEPSGDETSGDEPSGEPRSAPSVAPAGTGKRRGRPPGTKNKPKVAPAVVRGESGAEGGESGAEGEGGVEGGEGGAEGGEPKKRRGRPPGTVSAKGPLPVRVRQTYSASITVQGELRSFAQDEAELFLDRYGKVRCTLPDGAQDEWVVGRRYSWSGVAHCFTDDDTIMSFDVQTARPLSQGEATKESAGALRAVLEAELAALDIEALTLGGWA